MDKGQGQQVSNTRQAEQPKLIARKYRQISLWLTAGVALAILFGCRVSAQCDNIVSQVVNPLCVSVIFSLACSISYGEAWQAIAKSSPANLAKFYLVASALKMMAAALVFLIYVLVCDKANIIGFAAIFMLFYVVLLVFDCIYFARVEKKSRLA